jgi:hypothetical protein
MEAPRVHPRRAARFSIRRELVGRLHAAENPKTARQRGIASTIQNPNLVRRLFPMPEINFFAQFQLVLIIIQKRLHVYSAGMSIISGSRIDVGISKMLVNDGKSPHRSQMR